jgi:hypothetical protein
MSREISVWIPTIPLIMRVILIIFISICFVIVKCPPYPGWRVLEPPIHLLYRTIIRQIMLPQLLPTVHVERIYRRGALKVIDFLPGTPLRVPILMNNIALLGVYQVAHHVLVLRLIVFFVLFLLTGLHISKLVAVFLRGLGVIKETATLGRPESRVELG